VEDAQANGFSYRPFQRQEAGHARLKSLAQPFMAAPGACCGTDTDLHQ